MVRHDLIETYLEALRAEVGVSSDDVAEVSDHLYTAAEQAVADGLAPDVAAAAAVERFGDPRLVGATLAARSGSPALPTHFTTRIGIVGFPAGLAFVATGATWLAAASADGGDGWYRIGHATNSIATVLIALLVAAVRLRTGASVLGSVAVGTATLAALVGSTVSWAIPLWSGLLAATFLVLALPMLRTRVVPRWNVAVLALAAPIGTVAWAVLYETGFGGVDEWGEYPAASAMGVLVTGVTFLVGLSALGRTLRSETPVDVPGDRAVTA